MPLLPWRRPSLAYSIFSTTFGVITAAWLVLFAPELLAPGPPDNLLRKITNVVTREQIINDRLSAQSDIRNTILQGLGGSILLLGLYLTLRQYQLNQEGHITDRFSRAIDQLGSEKLAVRVGAIAALGRIARDSPRDHESVMECMAAFVREQSNGVRHATTGAPTTEPAHLRGDIQAAAAVLGSRPEIRQRDESRRINLRAAALARVHLRNAHYERVALTNADFRRSQLTGIHLNDALLRGAQFEKAFLDGAHLEGSYLLSANFRHASLAGATFEGAWLFGANFEGAQVNRTAVAKAYCTTEPFLSWLNEQIGAGPWKWNVLRERLDTPSKAAISALLTKLPVPAGRANAEEHAREGLRQIEYLLEEELTPSDADELHESQITRAMQTRGLAQVR